MTHKDIVGYDLFISSLSTSIQNQISQQFELFEPIWIY